MSKVYLESKDIVFEVLIFEAGFLGSYDVTETALSKNLVWSLGTHEGWDNRLLRLMWRKFLHTWLDLTEYFYLIKFNFKVVLLFFDTSVVGLFVQKGRDYSLFIMVTFALNKFWLVEVNFFHEAFWGSFFYAFVQKTGWGGIFER